MIQNINNSLEEKLKEFIGKNVIILQGGFLNNKYLIHKLKYFIEYEILNITDDERRFYYEETKRRIKVWKKRYYFNCFSNYNSKYIKWSK